MLAKPGLSSAIRRTEAAGQTRPKLLHTALRTGEVHAPSELSQVLAVRRGRMALGLLTRKYGVANAIRNG